MKFGKLLEELKKNVLFRKYLENAPFIQYAELKKKIKEIEMCPNSSEKEQLQQQFIKTLKQSIEKWQKYSQRMIEKAQKDPENFVKIYKVIQEFLKINKEGSRKIAKKFDKHTCPLCPFLQKQVLDQINTVQNIFNKVQMPIEQEEFLLLYRVQDEQFQWEERKVLFINKKIEQSKEKDKKEQKTEFQAIISFKQIVSLISKNLKLFLCFIVILLTSLYHNKIDFISNLRIFLCSCIPYFQPPKSYKIQQNIQSSIIFYNNHRNINLHLDPIFNFLWYFNRIKFIQLYYKLLTQIQNQQQIIFVLYYFSISGRVCLLNILIQQLERSLFGQQKATNQIIALQQYNEMSMINNTGDFKQSFSNDFNQRNNIGTLMIFSSGIVLGIINLFYNFSLSIIIFCRSICYAMSLIVLSIVNGKFFNNDANHILKLIMFIFTLPIICFLLSKIITKLQLCNKILKQICNNYFLYFIQLIIVFILNMEVCFPINIKQFLKYSISIGITIICMLAKHVYSSKKRKNINNTEIQLSQQRNKIKIDNLKENQGKNQKQKYDIESQSEFINLISIIYLAYSIGANNVAKVVGPVFSIENVFITIFNLVILQRSLLSIQQYDWILLIGSSTLVINFLICILKKNKNYLSNQERIIFFQKSHSSSLIINLISTASILFANLKGAVISPTYIIFGCILGNSITAKGNERQALLLKIYNLQFQKIVGLVLIIPLSIILNLTFYFMYKGIFI